MHMLSINFIAQQFIGYLNSVLLIRLCINEGVIIPITLNSIFHQASLTSIGPDVIILLHADKRI